MPQRSIEAAFKLIDTDGNGVLDQDEFRAFLKLAKKASHSGSMQKITPRAQTTGGAASSDNRTGSPAEANFRFLFGEDGTKTLSNREFVEFVCGLKRGLMELEWSGQGPDSQGTQGPHQPNSATMVVAVQPHIPIMAVAVALVA